MLSILLRNEFYIKNKVKNPIFKDQRALKKINFSNHFFKNKAFLPYSKFLKWDY